MRVYTGPEYCKCTIWYDISSVAAISDRVTGRHLFNVDVCVRLKIDIDARLHAMVFSSQAQESDIRNFTYPLDYFKTCKACDDYTVYISYFDVYYILISL